MQGCCFIIMRVTALCNQYFLITSTQCPNTNMHQWNLFTKFWKDWSKTYCFKLNTGTSSEQYLRSVCEILENPFILLFQLWDEQWSHRLICDATQILFDFQITCLKPNVFTYNSFNRICYCLKIKKHHVYFLSEQGSN